MTNYTNEPPDGGLFLLREMSVVYRGAAPAPCPRITSSMDVDRFVRNELELHQECVEHFIVILLDAKSRPIGWSTVAKGGVSACPVNLTDAFRLSVRAAASSVIFVHNHPSGDPSPSPEDVALTTRLRKAGDLLGVKVLDHVIVGSSKYFSFLDSGMMGENE